MKKIIGCYTMTTDKSYSESVPGEILCSDIKEIAKLSKIALTDEECAELTKHISDMLEYSEILISQQMNFENKLPSMTSCDTELRCDFPVQSLPQNPNGLQTRRLPTLKRPH